MCNRTRVHAACASYTLLCLPGHSEIHGPVKTDGAPRLLDLSLPGGVDSEMHATISLIDNQSLRNVSRGINYQNKVPVYCWMP